MTTVAKAGISAPARHPPGGTARRFFLIPVVPIVAGILAMLAPAAAKAQTPDARVTVRAVRIDTPLRIDGRLDEDFYSATEPNTNLIQTEPSPGQAFTEKTEFWIAYDLRNFYIVWRCWESQPERIVGTELRRDSNLIVSANDNVAFGLDTFRDRRNSVIFVVGPDGGRVDGQVTGERQWGPDWNPVWDVATERFDGGWIVEAAIPFRSLRYTPGSSSPWGFIARRMSRWKNEIGYLTPVPDGSASAALMWSSFYADLIGIETPPAGKNIEVKPYVTGSVISDRASTERPTDDFTGDFGVDLKYGIRQNLTADFTYNTDFAQVEADEQQVNLTRFSLFFPEKREFFLENQGTFAFGGSGAVGFGGGGNADVPVLFYSRRIGLEEGQAVPILGGGRLTGRLGGFEVGAMQIRSDAGQTARIRPTDFTAVRIKRDVFGKSSVGAMGTRRSDAPGRPGESLTYGVDARFGFGNDLQINSYWAGTSTPGLSGEDTSYRGQFDYNADRYGIQLERLMVGRNFNPDIGFVRRRDMEKSYGFLRFSPRPAGGMVRKYSVTAAMSYIENGAGQVETRQNDADFSVEFQNGDKVLVGGSRQYEFLARPFDIAPGVTIPAGGYTYHFARAGFDFGQQRPVFGQLRVEHGEFYDGHQTTVALRAVRAAVTHLLSVEPSISINQVSVGAGRFTSRLVGARITYTMTPRMFTSALVQYNSRTDSLGSNVRFRWEYLPGSELFVVYNDQRDTLGAGFPNLANRTVIIKLNRLLRF